MNKKTARRQRDLKSKLLAAVAMLLVSSMMMVTSTYAWFTLSTAPEVTGITTAVGANGNLEMALMYKELQNNDNSLIANWGDSITSGNSDSMDAAGKLISEANKTWGNLVDVSDYNTYGLHNIVLYPSALATEIDANSVTKIKANPLQRPVYGADGRVAELKADTLTASYASGTFSLEDKLGVRAVGTASSMTARELAYRAAMSAASTATSNAKSAAANALNTNGNMLAGMAIKYVGNASAKFTQAEVDALNAVIDALAVALNNVDDALVSYVAAHNIAPSSQSDATYKALQDKIEAMSVAQLSAYTGEDIVKPTGFDAVATKLASAKTAVNGAKITATKTEYVWDDVSGALSKVMDYNRLKLNGLTMNEVKDTDGSGNFTNASTIINAMGKEGLQLQMPSGSGVFADIADFCGEYKASIIFPEGTFVMGVGIGGVEATMVTSAPINPTYLAQIRTGTAAFAASAGASTAAKSITDFYGYIIDLAFRTNAAGSNLMLQSDAVDRIYKDNDKNEETMGGGASMTFTATGTFGVTKMKELMQDLRIVFFDPSTKAIMGYARLNPATVKEEGTTVTMKMGMWDPTLNSNAGGFAADAKIVELAQNEAKAVSVLVYLDGTSVKNADVAATGTTSMTGSMNLQFSSSAELKPMDYADLKDGKSDAEGSSDIKLTNVKADTATAAKGIAVAYAQAASVGTEKGFGVVLTGTVPANATITAKIGSETITAEATQQVVGGYRAYFFKTNTTLEANTAIEITVTEPVTTYTVTVPAGVTGDATATANTAYTFTVAEDYTLGTVTVGDTTVTPTAGENGSYTIPADKVTGAIVITATANNP